MRNALADTGMASLIAGLQAKRQPAVGPDKFSPAVK